MPHERPAFGITYEGSQPRGFLERPLPEWADSDLMAGLAQIAARRRRHPEYASELGKLSVQLADEQARRNRLYEAIAAVFLGTGDENGA